MIFHGRGANSTKRTGRWLESIDGLVTIRAVDVSFPLAICSSSTSAQAHAMGEFISRRGHRVIVLDRNPEGLKLAKRSSAVTADAMEMPFPNETFDVVMASLFFHQRSNEDCIRVLESMCRMARRLVLVNDLHRHPIAYSSIRTLAAFSKSVMFRHDAPASVLRAFTPEELLTIARRAGIPARVHRSFPYRLVLVAEK
jgi:hypothetical protein